MTRNRRFSMLWPIAGLLIAAPLWAQASLDSLSVSCPSQAIAGASVTCTLTLSLGADAVNYFSFGLSVSPNGAAPALSSSGTVRFLDATGNAAAQGVTASSTPTSVGALYAGIDPSPSGDGNPMLTGTLTLGTIKFNVPATAAGNQSYAVTVTGVGGDNRTVTPDVVVAINPGSPATVTVPFLTQTISFAPPTSVILGVAPFDLSTSASATSALAVGFASNSTSVCTISGTTVTILTVGSCSITASQGGNTIYSPATSVTQSITVNPQPTLSTSPSTLTGFSWLIGSSVSTATQGLTVSSGGTAYSAAFNSTSGGAWLTVTSPTSNPVVSLNSSVVSGLAAGSYSGAVVITDSSTSNSSLSIPVSLTVTAPALSTTPSALTAFSWTIGSTVSTDTQTLTVSSNTTAYSAAFSPTSGGAWLTVTSPTSNPVVSLNSSVVTGLAAGSYAGNVVITDSSASNSPVSIPVSLTVNAQPVLSTTPTTLTAFSWTIGSSVSTATQWLTVSSGSTAYSTAFTPTSGGAWLTVTSPASNPVVSLNSAVVSGLAAGTYAGNVVITDASAANSPFSVPVSLTVNAQPVLSTTPTTLTAFSWTIGSSVSAATQGLTVSSGSTAYSTAFTPTSGGAWLTVTSPASNPVVSLNSSVVTGLTPGTYAGNVVITDSLAANSPLSIPVSLTVSAQPVLSTTPTTLTAFSWIVGTSVSTATQGLTVSSSNTAYSAAFTPTSGGAWLTVTSPTSNPVVSLNSAVVTGLTAGTYSGAVAITDSSAGNSPLNIAVSLVVTAPTLSSNPSTLTAFSWTIGSSVSAATQSLTVSSSGTAYSAAFTPTSGGAWLTLTSPTSNPVVALNSSVVTGLAAGAYAGNVVITDSSASNSPLSIPVSLTVNAQPTLSTTPSTLTAFTWMIGSSVSAATQTLTVSSGSTAYSAVFTPTTGGAWIAVSSPTANPGVSLNSAVVTGLAAGSYTGNIVITDALAANSPLSIPVSLTVTAPTLSTTPSTLTAFSWLIGSSVSTTAQTLTVSSNNTAYSAAFTPTSGGAWLTVASPTSNPAVSLISSVVTGLAVGSYTGNVVITDSSASNSPLSIPVSLTVTAPTLSTAPSTLTALSWTIGSSVSTATQTLTVSSNTTAYSAVFSPTSGGAWLTVASPTSNPVVSLNSSVVAGLAAGTYTGNVAITDSSASNSPLSLPVSLIVSAQPTISATPSGLTAFSWTIGSSISTATQTLTVSSGNTSYSAAFSPTSGGAWLTVSSPASNPVVSLNSTVVSGLAAGTYAGNVVITDASAANSPFSVPVSLTVNPQPVISTSPTTLTAFTWTFGTTVSASTQTLTVSSSNTSYSAGFTPTSGGAWLTVTSPTSNPVVALNSPVVTGLAPGTYAGNVVITDSSAANSPFNVPVSLTVSAASQTITFNSLSGVNFGVAPFAVSATSTSNLAVVFTSATTSVCTVSGNMVAIAGIGTCTINANQAGNTNYSAAPQVPQSFTVSQGAQTISFGSLPNVAISASPVTLTATATSNLAVTYTSSTTAVCTVSGSSVALLTLGTCTIVANQGGNTNWLAAAAITQNFTVSAATQTITFGPLSNVGVTASSFGITATASSGLTVTFASTTLGVCTVSGSTVSIVAQGTCSITASQAGNANFATATPVTQSFSVVATGQTITFNPLSNMAFGAAPFTLNASTTSNLTVTFASTTPDVCTVAGSTVTLRGAGTCSITASQAGGSGFAAATPVTQTFSVTGGTQTITFGALPGVGFGAAPFALSATASSGLTVAFASNTLAVCTVSGNTVTIVAVGSCSITASQAGNTSFSAATPVTQIFAVGLGSQTITFGALSNVSLGAAPFPVGATASSGLTVSFASTTLPVCTVSGNIVTILAAGTCTIAASQAGNASYAAAPTVSQSFTVSPLLTITTAALPAGVQGSVYSQTLIAANGSGALTWTLLAGSLPAGVTLGTNGALGGTPTASGAFSFTAKVTDSASNVAQQGLSLQINAPLTITTATLTNAIQGVAYNQSLAATGGLGAETWSVSAGALPAGIALSSAGALSGAPTVSGPFSFTAKVADTSSDVATQVLSLQVNAPLTITTSGTLPNGVTGTAYSTPFAATGGTGGPYTWSVSLGTTPAGLTLSSAGVLSGNPSVAGASSFTVSVNDGISAPAKLPASMTVYGTLSITTAFLPNGTVGTAYTPLTVIASGGSGNLTWTATGLPAGLSISTAGVISGTPSAAVTSNATLNATDSVSSQKTSVTLSITIAAATTTLKISPSSLVIGAGTGAAVNGAFTASGGTPAYTFSLAGGALPAGITLGSNGAVTGSTTLAGNVTVTVNVTDSASATATAQLTINILGLTTTTLPAGAATVPYGFAFIATGGTQPYTFSATGLPSTLSVSGGGLLSGTPTAAATLSFTVKVSDSVGVTASAPISLIIKPAPVSIPTVSLPNGAVGTAYSQTLSASGGTTPYTWKLLSGALPASLTLATNGKISGTPTVAGAPTFAVQVTDALGSVASSSVGILIQPKPVTVTTASLPSGIVGFNYAQQVLGATGGTSPYSFAITSGGLPPGFTLTHGVIAGTPSGAGTFPLTVTATDSVGAKGSASLSILVRASSADLVLQSGSATFSMVQGAATLPQPVKIGVQSSGISFAAYTVAVSPAAPWLNTPGNGLTPGQLTLSLTNQATLLSAGSNETLVTLTCTTLACAGKTQSLPVYLNITAPPPVLTVLTPFLGLSTNGAPPLAQTGQLGIQNTGGGTLSVTSMSCEASSWCSVGTFPASLAAGATAQVNVTVDPTTLKAGFYITLVDIVTSGGSASVPVWFFIYQAPTMTLAPSGEQFTMQAGGAPGNPNGSFQVNLAGGSVSWAASVLPGSSWLTLNTPSGTASDAQAGNITFTINNAAAALGVNTFYATIRVTASGVDDSPNDFQVVLNVTPATQPMTLSLSPAGLVFLTTVGSSPAPRTITVSTNSTAVAGYTASAATVTGSWLSVSPASSTTSSASPDKSTVTVNAGLAQGVYLGGVAYAPNGASGVQVVNVGLVVLPAGFIVSSDGLTTSSLTGGSSPQAVTCTPSQLVPVQVGLVDSFSVAASWPTPLAILLVTDCGAPVTNGQVVVAFSNGDPPLTLSPVNGTPGLYSGTWAPQQAAAQVTVSALATAPGFPSATSLVSGSVAPNAVPGLTANGTTLPYNPQTGGALAPGSIVFIAGSNLATASAQATSTPLPLTLGGTSVTIGGLPAPLFYVSPELITAQVPFALTPSQQYQVVVNANGR